MFRPPATTRHFAILRHITSAVLFACASASVTLPIAVPFIVAFAPASHAADTENMNAEDRAFEAVFNDPGNVALNFTLVGAQLRNGNFKEAAGTLERILILLPDEPRAQMLLASVQFKLGNSPEAERLAKKVTDNPLANDAQKNEAETLLARLENDKRLFDFSGTIGLGFGIADNPVGGSRGNVAQPLVGGEFGVNDKRANAEEFSTATIMVNLKRNLVAQMPRSISLIGNLYTRDYATYQDGDMTSAGLTTLYSQSTQTGRYTASLGASVVTVGDQPYQNSYQMRLGYDHLFANGINMSLGASGERKVFKKFDSNTNTQKTGNTHGANTTLGYVYKDTRFAVDMAVSDVNAADAKNEKNKYSAGISATSLLLPGVTTVRLGVAKDNYRALDTTYTNSPFYKRKDDTNSLRLTYIIGLESLDQPNGSEPFVNLSSTYSKTKSNIANFTKYSGDVSLTINHPF